MSERLIKHMRDRFLGWKLPDPFCPDNGITFTPTAHQQGEYGPAHWPSGTNLFDATQADAMVRYMMDGRPAASPAEIAGEIITLLQAFAKATGCPLGTDVIDWYANEHGKHVRKAADPVFVFGSNLAGRHGAGAAKWALQNRGAIYGAGLGRQGNSYALPTKDGSLRTLPLEVIRAYVDQFIIYAQGHPDLTFQLTPIGCGLAGYDPHQIAPMFRGAPPNVLIPPEFQEWLS